MKARLIFLGTLALVSAILGCGDDATGPPIIPDPPLVCPECLDSGATPPLLPLEEGNYWTYDYYQYYHGMAWETLSGWTTHDSALRVVVEKPVDLEGIEWYGVTCRGANHFIVSYFARNCPTGYCVGDYAELCMQYNSAVAAGEGYWNRIDTASGTGDQWFTYLGDSTGIEVPAGTFDCRFYLGEASPSSDGWPCCCYVAPGRPVYGVGGPNPGFCCGHGWYSNHWIAPGVGIVKMEIWCEGLEQPVLQRWMLKETNVTAGR